MFRSQRASQLFRFLSGSKIQPARANFARNVVAPIVGVGVASAALVACLLDKENPFEIEGDLASQSTASMITADRIIRVDDKVTVGRSRGHIVWTKDVAGTSNVFYTKKVFGRVQLLNELVLCGLLHDLFKDTDTPFPAVYALERNAQDGKKYYSFMSEDVGGTTQNSNLLQFMAKQSVTELDISKLKNIGVIVAFNRLVGNSDCNMKNFILHQQAGNDYVYGIDFEYGFIHESRLLTSAEQALETIVELITPAFHLTTTMHFNDAVAAINKTKLLAAIKSELDDDSVLSFYRRFAGMSHAQVEASISRLDGLIKPEEKAYYLEKINNSQQLARIYLDSFKIAHEPARLLTKQ